MSRSSTAHRARKTRRSRCSARTTASTPTARSGWQASGTTRTTFLGWRRVITIGDDYDFPYTQTAGFVAEFCSLREVVDRLWPPLGEEDTSYIAQIPDDIDGFYLSVGGTGTLAFVKQYEQLKGFAGDKIIGGSIAIDPTVLTDPDVGPRMVGVVSGSLDGRGLDHAGVHGVRPDHHGQLGTGRRGSRPSSGSCGLGSLRGKLGQRR